MHRELPGACYYLFNGMFERMRLFKASLSPTNLAKMNWFYAYRNFVLGTALVYLYSGTTDAVAAGLCTVVSVTELGLTARWTKATTELGYYFEFEGLGVYISSLSCIVFAVM